MTTNGLGRMAATLAAAGLVLSTAACDLNQEQREVQAHNAKIEKAEADDKVKRQTNHAVECISAMRWKKSVIASAGVGSVDLYEKHYRDQLLKVLGDTVVPAADGAPELSKASVDPYLDWAYDTNVKTKFSSGRDFNNDGTVSPQEANAQGNASVASCIQMAAEAGVGPLAGKDKTGRMFKMKAFSDRLAKSS